jgi:hypothetical protein
VPWYHGFDFVVVDIWGSLTMRMFCLFLVADMMRVVVSVWLLIRLCRGARASGYRLLSLLVKFPLGLPIGDRGCVFLLHLASETAVSLLLNPTVEKKREVMTQSVISFKDLNTKRRRKSMTLFGS